MIEAEFVGRGAEITRALDLLTLVERGEPQLLLVMGEAGVGKSTFAERIAAHAIERGFETACGACTSLSEPVPFAPFGGLLRDLGTRPRLRPLLHGHSAARALAEGSDGDVTRSVSPGVAEDLTQFLIALNTETSTLLMIEDLHWADRPSLEFLSHLARSLADERLIVVGTVRSPVGSEVNQQLLGELLRHRRVERLELAPFDLVEVHRLVRLVTKEVPSEALVTDLLAKSGGNPFLARELIRIDPSEWDQLPGAVGDIVRAVLVPLPSATRRMLEVASLMPAHIDAQTVATVSEMSVVDVEEDLEIALDADVLRFDGRDLTFRHALLRDACSSGLLPTRCRRLHGRIADALGASTRPDLGEIARHLEQAERFPEALDASMTAVEQTGDEHGSIGAIPHYQRALRLWAVIDDAPQRTGSSLFAVAQAALECAFYVGDTVAARDFARTAIQDADPSVQPDEAVVIACRLSELAWQHGDTAESLELLDRAGAWIGPRSGPAARAHVLERRSFHEAMQGAAAGAEQLAKDALELAREAGDDELQIEILHRVGLARAIGGAFVEGLAMLREARDLAFVARHHRSVIRGTINLTALLFSAGDLTAARYEGEQGSRLADDLGAPKAWQAHAHAWLARTLIAMGDLRAAGAVLDVAASPPAEMFRSVVDVAGAELALVAGELRTARELIDRVTISRDDHLAWWLHTGVLERRILLADDHTDRAAAGLEELLDVAEHWPDTVFLQLAGIALQTIGRSDRSRADTILDRCEARAEQLHATLAPSDTDARLAAVRALHATCLGARPVDLWLTAARMYADCGRPIDAGWATIEAARTAEPGGVAFDVVSASVHAGPYRPPAELVEAADALSGRTKTTDMPVGEPTVFAFGDCEVDLSAYEVRIAGAPTPAEPQVFDLISYMVRNPGELLTKERLLDEIWGDRFVSASALAVRIKTARRVLGDDGQRQEVIRTVHGRGYKFVAAVRITGRS